MEKGEQGDVIIRPSSKGSDHLTATWKVGDGCLSHIDIKEEGKVNPFSLGKSLSIENEVRHFWSFIISLKFLGCWGIIILSLPFMENGG